MARKGGCMPDTNKLTKFNIVPWGNDAFIVELCGGGEHEGLRKFLGREGYPMQDDFQAMKFYSEGAARTEAETQGYEEMHSAAVVVSC